MKIKIVSCLDKRMWYRDNIGDVYDVSRETFTIGSRFEKVPAYWVLEDGKECGIVHKSDTEVVEDDDE